MYYEQQELLIRELQETERHARSYEGETVEIPCRTEMRWQITARP